MNIKEVELVLENCEVISIDAKYIGKILAKDIYPEISNTDCGIIKRKFCCDTFCIELHKDLDKYGFIKSYKLMPNVFNRLMDYNDITQVVVRYDDDVIETYFVDYDGYEENANQRSRISAAGHLYIKISLIHSIDDMFDKSTLEDPDYKWPWVRA